MNSQENRAAAGRSNRLNAKDFITIGIFSAISFVVMLVAGVTNLSPYTYLLYSVTYALFGGIIYLYIGVKIPKRGSLILIHIVPFLYMMFTGVQGMMSAAGLLVFSIIADWIADCRRRDIRRIRFSYLVFTLWASVVGEYRFFMDADAYFSEALRSGLDDGYVFVLRSFSDPKWWILSIVVTLVASVLGMLLASAVMKKYLVRAGVV